MLNGVSTETSDFFQEICRLVSLQLRSALFLEFLHIFPDILRELVLCWAIRLESWFSARSSLFFGVLKRLGIRPSSSTSFKIADIQAGCEGPLALLAAD